MEHKFKNISREFDLLKSLEVFVTVSETGSMTAAAARLHITQSAISQQIKILETDLNTSLFYRDVRPLRLTPAGLVLRGRADSLLLSTQEMRTAVRNVASGRLPHLRIAILSTFARQLAPAILRAIEDQHLSVDNVTITRGMSINHARDLAQREIDAAWTSDALLQATDLERLMIIRESYLIITPRDFGWKDTSLKDLSLRLAFLRYSTRTQSGQRIESHLRRLRLPVKSSPVFESSVDLIDAVASGHGWSIVTPSQLFETIGSNLPIRARPLPSPGLRRSLGLVWRSGELQDTIRQLMSVCIKTFKENSIPHLLAEMPDLEGQIEILPTSKE